MSQQAVLFDVDGVLVDSYQAHFKSWRAMLGEQGVEFTEAEFRATFGRTSADIIAELYKNDLSTDEIQQLDDRKEALYREILREDFTPVEGAAELVDSLAAEGFALGVGSSGPPANVMLTLESLGRVDKFAAIITGADVTRGKPDPQVFQLGAEQLGVSPENCAVVEDATAGIEAANNAGMTSIALVGTATRDELSHAKRVVDSLRELSPEGIGALISG